MGPAAVAATRHAASMMHYHMHDSVVAWRCRLVVLESGHNLTCCSCSSEMHTDCGAHVGYTTCMSSSKPSLHSAEPACATPADLCVPAAACHACSVWSTPGVARVAQAGRLPPGVASMSRPHQHTTGTGGVGWGVCVCVWRQGCGGCHLKLWWLVAGRSCLHTWFVSLEEVRLHVHCNQLATNIQWMTHTTAV